MTYDEKLNHLKSIKDKYRNELCKIAGFHGVGVRVNELKIVVYVDEITPNIMTTIPFELDGVPVEVIGSTHSKPVATNQYLGGAKGYCGSTTYHGTTGSHWYSQKWKRPVIISCNHVFANADKMGEWEFIKIPITINGISNGFTYVYENYLSYTDNFYRTKDKPTITGINTSPNLKSGDYIEIWGTNFGNFLIAPIAYINGKPQTTLQCKDKVMILKLNDDIPLGIYDLTILIKGANVDCGYYTDTATAKKYTLGNIIEYPKLYTGIQKSSTDYPDKVYDSSELNADVCIVEPYDRNLIDARIVQHGSSLNTNANYTFYGTGRVKTIKGICRTPRENLPVTWTGVTSGTVYALVTDVSFDEWTNYGSGYTWHFDQMSYVYTGKNGTNPLLAPALGGTSGSTAIVASIDEAIEFFDTYNINYPSREIMDASYKNADGIQDVFIDDYVGNVWGAVGSEYRAVTDKAAHWIDIYRLEPLATTTQTYPDEVKPISSASGVSTVAYVEIPDAIVSTNIQSVSSFGVSANKVQSLSDFNLVSVPKITDLTKIEFYFGTNDLIASAKINATSNVKAKALYKELIAQLKVNGISTFKTKANADLLAIAKVADTSNVKSAAQLFETILTATAKISEQSIVKTGATLPTAPDLQISVKFGETSALKTKAELTQAPLTALADIAVNCGFNTTALIYEYIHGQQYETITFTIQRELTIEFEITKSIDLNLAV